MKRNFLPKSFTISLDDRFFIRIIRIILLIIGFFLFLQLLPLLNRVIATLVAAILITTVLDPIVSTMENKGVNRIGAILLVFLSISVFLTVAVYAASPLVTEQIDSLSESLQDESPAHLVDTAKNVLFENIPFLKSPEVQKQVSEKMENAVNVVMAAIFSTAVTLIISFPYFIIIAFSVFFFLKDGWLIKRAFVQAMPNRYFEISLIVIHKMTEQLGRYIRGQLVVSTIIGTLSIFALTLLDIPYSFFIGAIAGLANMIPYFGPLIGILLAVTVALLYTPSLGLVMAIIGAFATIQLIDNILVSPYIVSRSVELHPLAVIIVILIGTVLLGLWGALLAVPVASILKVTFSSIRWGLQNYRLKERTRFESG
ncbi:MAG: AI-2E family transporter [bacterium]